MLRNLTNALTMVWQAHRKRVYLQEKKDMKKRGLVFLLMLCTSLAATLTAQSTIIQNENLRWRMNGNGQLSDSIWLEMNNQNGWTPLVSNLGIWVIGEAPNGAAVFLSTAPGGEPNLAGSEYVLNKVWRVTAEDIARHRADFEDNGVIDDPIPAIFSWPAQNNAFFNAYNAFDLPFEDLLRLDAGYFDVNGTGHYDPDNGDFPVLPVRGCGAEMIIPTEMHYCVFTTTSTGSSGTTLPLEIQLYTFTFGCAEEDHPLNQTVFTLHKVVYTDGEASPGVLPDFTNCYWGQWVDPDLGCPFDDYVGSFPERQAAYVYNSADTDCSWIGSDFGDQPPALGIDALRGPLDAQGNAISIGSISYYNNASGSTNPPATTDPVNLLEYYNYLRGYWRDGTALTVGGTGYNGSTPTQFAFPGLPEQVDGWTEWEAQNAPGDRRLLLSYGAFSLEQGAVNEMITAYTVYRGPGNHLDQATGLLDQIDLVQNLFNTCFDVESTPDFPVCTAISTNVFSAPPVAALSIAPNPATTWLDLELPVAGTYACTLRDLHGRVVLSQVLGAGRQRLPLPTLPAGLYVLSAQAESGKIMVAKVVVAQ